MSKRPSVADAIRSKVAAPGGRSGARFITFPVSPAAKVQFDVMAVQSGRSREDLMREALRDLFKKHCLKPID